MKKIMMDIIENIKRTSDKEAQVVKAIIKHIPQAECIRSWTSYDTVEKGIATKELHWRFNFLGHEIEMFTTHNGHMSVNISDEYTIGYWWSTENGYIATSHQRPLKKWETYISDKILDIMVSINDRSFGKWALPQELHYGKYVVFTVNAEIICKDTTTGKSWRLFHTPFGKIGSDTDFPVEIRDIIMKNFMRK
jgi:hypothetical protein